MKIYDYCIVLTIFLLGLLQQVKYVFQNCIFNSKILGLIYVLYAFALLQYGKFLTKKDLMKLCMINLKKKNVGFKMRPP